MTDSYMIRAAALGGGIRAFAVDSTAVVQRLFEVHRTAPAVTAAIGRLATGALLMGSLLKEEEQLVTLRVRGDGPAGTLIASANGRGEVRGLVSNPRPDADQVRNGKLDVAGMVGTTGRLSVVRDLGVKQPYSSTVELVSGEIGEDLAYYFTRSEQTPSAVGLGVFVNTDGSVEAAGGYVVQVLGGLSASELEELETTLADLPHPTSMLRSGDRPEDILGRIFGNDYMELERTSVRFHCPCSRERAERALMLIGARSLEDLLESDREKGFSELVCEFCGRRYRFGPDEIGAIMSEAHGDAGPR